MLFDIGYYYEPITEFQLEDFRNWFTSTYKDFSDKTFISNFSYWRPIDKKAFKERNAKTIEDFLIKEAEYCRDNNTESIFIDTIIKCYINLMNKDFKYLQYEFIKLPTYQFELVFKTYMPEDFYKYDYSIIVFKLLQIDDINDTFHILLDTAEVNYYHYFKNRADKLDIEWWKDLDDSIEIFKSFYDVGFSDNGRITKSKLVKMYKLKSSSDVDSIISTIENICKSLIKFDKESDEYDVTQLFKPWRTRYPDWAEEIVDDLDDL